MTQNQKLLAILLLLVLAMTLKLHAAHCSTAASAGKWAYTYSGSIMTPNGPLPVAAVGHFSADAAGNTVGSQTRSVGGASGVEDFSGTFNVSNDCSGTSIINVFVNGQVQRTAVLALVFDKNQSHARGIFQSLVLSDGNNVPVVITLDYNKLFPKD